MGIHRTYPQHRRRRPRNYFGDGTDGAVTISANTNLASTQDGDMVVKHYKSLTINAGCTLSTANRCRGLLIYVQGDCTINGIISMSARGPKANPADSGVTSYTPIAPTDGHAVPADGITIRRFASGQSGSDIDDDLMWGCGASAVAAEAKQPKVPSSGLVIRIPRVGGAGVAAGYTHPGTTGGTLANAPGGGGLGSGTAASIAGASTPATCFSGGTGSGGANNGGVSLGATPYGGAGSDGVGGNGAGGGAGNPSGVGTGSGVAGNDGTGGLIILIVGGNLSLSGQIVSAGVAGGCTGGLGCGGGGTGGGVVAVLYAGSLVQTGTITAPGGPGGDGQSGYAGGPGGVGAVIGPTKIDPA